MPRATVPELRVAMLAKESLTQLKYNCVLPLTGVIDYEKGSFTLDDSVKIRRPKRRVAVNYDPREGGGISNEAEFFGGTLSLEVLWRDSYPVYSNTPDRSFDIYVQETATQIADAIGRANDQYVASKLRAYTATSGNVPVYLGDHPFIAMTASVDPTTGQLAKFRSDALLSARTTLKSMDVPDSDLYGVLSTAAEGAFIGDATELNRYVAAQIPGPSGGQSMYQQGIRRAQFVDRYGIKCTGSNSIYGQSALTALDGANAAVLPIASVAEDTTKFFYADMMGNVPIGCLDITLTANTALNPAVGIGHIVRIGPSTSNAMPKGFGVILRINNAATTAPIITMAVYTPEGRQLRAGEIVAGTDVFSIPLVPSVNPVYHREALLIANRELRTDNAQNVLVKTVVDPDTKLTLQLFQGNFDIDRLRSVNAAYCLTGAKVSDWRKGCFVLSL